jgi:sigma-E factor negative regulatory protein RseA
MKEHVSQLMDSELDGRERRAALDALRRDGQAAEAWSVYHLISDAMRETPWLSEDFTARFAARLAAEPTVLAPALRMPSARSPLVLAAAASASAVALVGWLALTPPQVHAPAPQLAQAPSAAAKAAATPVRLLPGAEANDYLLAHQGFASRVYLHGMAPYIRTVSEPSGDAAR